MKAFVAGPRAVKKLDEWVEGRLAQIMGNGFSVLVGDARGVDSLVQQYMHRSHYRNVTVYASQGKPRNNVGGWKTEAVKVQTNARGFAFYAAKDLKMAEDADFGFMVWNGKSKGTLSNILNLAKREKRTLVYLTTHKKVFVVQTVREAGNLVSNCCNDAIHLFDELSKGEHRVQPTGAKQLSMF